MIENAKIIEVDLSMADHGCFTLELLLETKHWAAIYGGHCLGHGYLNSKKFDSSPFCGEYIMRIMDVVGVECFNDMKNKYIRVETNGNSPITKIGNIIEDKWFDQKEFFKEKEKEIMNENTIK